jgi:creatinine amidohydrolase/Fe(II)-dependent formamide hydrolase-like protein
MQVLLSSHKTNASLLTTLVHELADQGIVAAHLSYWGTASEEVQSAREMETSSGLCPFPELVGLDVAVSEPIRPRSSLSSRELLAPGMATLAAGSSRSHKTGVLGDPMLANPIMRRRIIEVAAYGLSSFLHEFGRNNTGY